jgi:hypothetical protein
MQVIQKAVELVTKNETAIALFTHGEFFHVDAASGNGWSGNWVLSPDNLEMVDRVIIYLRGPQDTTNRIFYGTYTTYQKTTEARRYVVRFTNLKEIGATPNNWIDFADSGQNPVSYVSR